MEKYIDNESDYRTKVREQIIAIRDSGTTNMFDARNVRELAYMQNYDELVVFIDNHKSNYLHFILTGKDDLIVI